MRQRSEPRGERRRPYAGMPAVAVMTATLVLLVSACSGAASTKAGGDAAPVTLRMANPNGGLEYTPAVQDFVTRLEKNSNGALRVHMTDKWGNFQADAERRVVEAVASGKVDLAWVGSRVFDTMGVRSFQALNAPLLVDSYALQRKVVASDVPAAMMKGLDKLKVTGLAVLGGGLRKPIGVTSPVQGPADWRGRNFQTFPSQVQADAIRALGAKPVQAGPTGRTEGVKAGTIDSFEVSMRTYAINTMTHTAPYMTVNVSLWPEMPVLITNPHRLAALTSANRGSVRAAAWQAAARSVDLVDKDDALASELCSGGARLSRASAPQLRALRNAVAPVYRRLEQDPDTRRFLDEIRRLKESVTAEPAPLAHDGCSAKSSGTSDGGGSTTAPKNVEGTYRWTLSKDDARKYGTANEDLRGYPVTFTMRLNDGRWLLTHTTEQETDQGTYKVEGDRCTFLWPDLRPIVFVCSADSGGDLHLKPVEPMDPGDRFVWSTHTWTRIG